MYGHQESGKTSNPVQLVTEWAAMNVPVATTYV